jgi:hypothetical protein
MTTRVGERVQYHPTALSVSRERLHCPSMARQGYDLQLTRYDDLLPTAGMEHSPTSATGTAWERTPWHATQRAAWDALRQAEPNRVTTRAETPATGPGAGRALPSP